jgi:hypothetical protein
MLEIVVHHLDFLAMSIRKFLGLFHRTSRSARALGACAI